MGTLLAIAVKPARRAPMVETETARVTVEGGLDENAQAGSPQRQITVLSQGAWRDACAELDTDLPWTMRRANLLVEGVDLAETLGQQLRVGSILLEVSGETEPCGLMESQHAGLLQALRPQWRGGVCCRVVEGGEIAVGDAVAWSS